jgi:hypothetical protein
MDSFSPSETAKNILGTKNKNDKLHHSRKSKQILPQSYFLKNAQILTFWEFSNF